MGLISELKMSFAEVLKLTAYGVSNNRAFAEFKVHMAKCSHRCSFKMELTFINRSNFLISRSSVKTNL